MSQCLDQYALKFSAHHTAINMDLLKKYPEYREFRTSDSRTTNSSSDQAVKNSSEQTPEELLEYSYQEIRATLAQEILEQVKSCSPTFFERLVVELLVKMGYGGSINEAGRAIGKTGDEGIDGIIKENCLGLDEIYIQAKRWNNVVGRPEIQKFVGALAGKGATKGILIRACCTKPKPLEFNALRQFFSGCCARK